jgi:hypothetical protein
MAGLDQGSSVATAIPTDAEIDAMYRLCHWDCKDE